MTRSPSHVVPDGSLPETAMREQLSKAYLHMIASAAGVDLGNWNTDYDGIDVTVKSRVDYAPNTLGPKIDVQLKCTGQEKAVRDETVAWSLETKTVQYLRAPHRSNPGLFCVLHAPEGPGLWLSHDLEGLLAHSHMYWLWGSDLPEPKLDQDKQVVHLPKQNVMNPQSLLDLMEVASAWRVD